MKKSLHCLQYKWIELKPQRFLLEQQIRELLHEDKNLELDGPSAQAYRRLAMTTKSGLIGAALVLVSMNVYFSTTAYGAPISGTGDPNTNAALSGATMETFDAGPAGETANLTLSNVTFVGVDGTFTLGNEFIGQYNTRGVYSIYNGGDGIPSNFRFDFAAPVQAFAFNWGAADVSWTLTAYDANDVSIESLVLTATGGSNAGEYFGIAATNIAYATLIAQAPGDWVFIDNFTDTDESFAAPNVAVPVLPMPMLIVMALLLAATGHRRLRRQG